MKIGVMAPFYPAEGEGFARTMRLLDECERHRFAVLDRPPLPEDPAELAETRDRAAALGVEIEMRAAGVFALADQKSRAAAERDLRASIDAAREFGSRIVRTGYGRLTLETSRFAARISPREHLAWYAESLERAAEIVSGTGVLLGIENHCDFTGRQLAPLFAKVRDAGVGVALDTANGVTIFSDPNDDIQALAPYAVTTHCKDMQMIDNPDSAGIPFLPVGCAPGKGFVDFVRLIELLPEVSIVGDSISLIVEPGWERPGPDDDPREFRLTIYLEGARYLRAISE